MGRPVVLAAALLVCAVPAAAQTFRGIAPGDPVGALDALGEPYQSFDMGPGLVSAQWDLEDQQLFSVHELDGRVLLLGGYDYAPRGRIAFNETPASEVFDIIGSEPGYFENGSPVVGLFSSGIWSVAWPLEPERNGFMVVRFRGDWSDDMNDTADPPLPVPANAVVTEIQLVHADYVAAREGEFGPFIPGADTASVGPLEAIFTE